MDISDTIWLICLIYFSVHQLLEMHYYSVSSSTSPEIDLGDCQSSVWIGYYSFSLVFLYYFLFRLLLLLLSNIQRAHRLNMQKKKEIQTKNQVRLTFTLDADAERLLSLAPVVFLCVAERVAARRWGRLHETLPEVSVGDLPPGPPARVGRANGVCAP